MTLNKCVNCEHARKAFNESVVVCGKAWEDYREVSPEHWPKHIQFSGWGYPGRRPNTETTGTVGEGAMVNNMPLIEKEKEMKCFEYRKDIET